MSDIDNYIGVLPNTDTIVGINDYYGRFNNVNGATLPSQTNPNGGKDDSWKKSCIDVLESIGLSVRREKRDTFNVITRMYEGDIAMDKKEISPMIKSFMKYLSSNGKGDVINDMENFKDQVKFDFLRTLVDKIIQIYLDSPSKVVVDVIDNYSQNEYSEMQTKQFWDMADEKMDNLVSQKLINEGYDLFKDSFQSKEDYDAYIQQINKLKDDNIPQAYKDERGKPIKLVIQEFAEKIIETDQERFRMQEVRRNLFKDRILYGEYHKHIRVGLNYYKPEYWEFYNVFYKTTPTNNKSEKCEIIGYQNEMTANEIIERVGHLLTKEQIESIENTFANGAVLSNTNYANSYSDALIKLGSNTELSTYDGEGTERQFNSDFAIYATDNGGVVKGKFLFTEGYWHSYKLMGLIRLDGGIESFTEDIDREYLKQYFNKTNKYTLAEFYENGKNGEYIWYYEPEVRYGVKINNVNGSPIYLGGEPIMYQIYGEIGNSEVLNPVTGIITQDSIPKRIESEMKLYAYYMDRAKSYAEKELGVFFLFDYRFASILSDDGDDGQMDKTLENMYAFIQDFGMLPRDGSPSSLKGGTDNDPMKLINADLSALVKEKIDLAQIMKRIAFEKLGMPYQESITPTPKDMNWNNVAPTNSYSTLELVFDEFRESELVATMVHCEVAKWVIFNKGGYAEMLYINSDGQKSLINFNDINSPLRRFGLRYMNDKYKLKMLEDLKNAVLSMNTLGQTPEDLIEFKTADSTLAIREYLKLKREEKQKLDEIAHQRQLELNQQNIDAETAADNREHIQDIEILNIKEQYALKRQAILASGFAKDSEGRSSIFDELDTLIKRQNADTKALAVNSSIQQNMLNSQLSNENKKRELDIKERHVDALKYNADRAFDIAVENKTQYEIKNFKKNKGKDKKS